MNKKVLLSAIAVTLLGSAAVFAAQAPAQPMSFFVTSTTPNGSGNLGGLAGADKICQDLAAAALVLEAARERGAGSEIELEEIHA